MKRRRNVTPAAAASPSGAIDPAAELALSRARVGELEATEGELRARLAAAEAAASELRAANEALAREHAALKQEHAAALFDWRPRDFAAELPAGVLLKIMDHAPDGRCAEPAYIFIRGDWGSRGPTHIYYYICMCAR